MTRGSRRRSKGFNRITFCWRLNRPVVVSNSQLLHSYFFICSARLKTDSWSIYSGYCPEPCFNENAASWTCDPDVEECEEEFPCDYSLQFTTLEQVAMISAEDEYCKFGHTLTALLAMFDAAIVNYHAIDSGYDSAFGHYEDSVIETIQPSLDRFVQPAAYTRGNKYFTCRWTDGSSQTCPINTFEWFGDSWDLNFDLNDEAGFFQELYDKYGVLKEWVKFGDYSEYIDRSCPSSPCFPSTRYVNTNSQFPKQTSPYSAWELEIKDFFPGCHH